jgi:hypothetical protein
MSHGCEGQILIFEEVYRDIGLYDEEYQLIREGLYCLLQDHIIHVPKLDKFYSMLNIGNVDFDSIDFHQICLFSLHHHRLQASPQTTSSICSKSISTIRENVLEFVIDALSLCESIRIRHSLCLIIHDSTQLLFFMTRYRPLRTNF